jgi:hypothetical protein
LVKFEETKVVKKGRQKSSARTKAVVQPQEFADIVALDGEEVPVRVVEH